MSYENINLWFARDEKDKIVTIDKINEENKHLKYKCPICGSEIIPKAIKEDTVMSRHFAHIDKSKCDSETQIHFWIKNELIKKGDIFKVKLDDEVKEFICKEVLIEQSYKTEFGTYKPDITVLTENNKTIYVEVANTNKKKIEEYLDIWINLNNIVIEVDAKDLLNGNSIKEFKAMFYEGKCFNISKEDKDYYELIGKIKLNKNKYPVEQVNKLNWLWRDINKYLLGEIEISEISDLIQAIEDEELREIVVSILRKNRCTGIMEDYIKYNKNLLEKRFKDQYNMFDYFLSDEHLVKDRIYKGFIITICKNDYIIYSGKISFNYNNIKDYLLENCKINYIKFEMENILKDYLKDGYKLIFKDYSTFYELYLYYNDSDKFYIEINEEDTLENIKDNIIYEININNKNILTNNIKCRIINELKNIGYSIVVNDIYGSIKNKITFQLEYGGLNKIDIKIDIDKSINENIDNIKIEYRQRVDVLIKIYDIFKEYEDRCELMKNSYRISNLNNEICIYHQGNRSFMKQYEEIGNLNEVLDNEVFKKCLIEDLEDYKDYNLLSKLENLLKERLEKVEKNANISFYISIYKMQKILKITRKELNKKDIDISEYIPQNIYDEKELFEILMGKISNKLRKELYKLK